MKKGNAMLIALIAVVAVAVIGGGAWYYTQGKTSYAPSNSSMQAAENSVSIKGYAFTPPTITVKAGEFVTWTNNDTVAHTATADDDSWDTGMIEPGETGTIRFEEAGTYTYHCTPHPQMKGTIIVE